MAETAVGTRRCSRPKPCQTCWTGPGPQFTIVTEPGNIYAVLDNLTGRTCYRDSRWDVVSSQRDHLNRTKKGH